MNNLRQRSRQTLLFLALFQFFSAGQAFSQEQVQFETDQGVVKLDDLRGQVVYLDFWASWCSPCRKSFPWMRDMQERYAAKGLKIIAVNLDKDRAVVAQFLKKYPANFTVAYDPDGVLAQKFNVKGMPNSYLIDRNGAIKLRHIGFRTRDVNTLEQAIKSELKK